ncbi:hypothetical protein Taro_025185 [Colocasia esculenta]|uniref:NAC domain-containing protein n=1 Tax=Colocasia esculenta TaxID=4460 RepID=A0A843VDG9_COLES|nr:hypothetical protein [Colocasia esculenta]
MHGAGRFRYPMKDECYFYTMRTKKYPNGSRPSRSTPSGYWKATGRDADVVHGGVVVGMRKSLVFYFGRSPAGQKTNWLMHEFRINEKLDQYRNHAEPERDRYVLCKVYKKDEPRDDGSREAKHWAEGGNIYAHNSIIPSRVDAQF